ncbi:MAG TPA: hypothetical protein VK753_09590 [Xanthomonadaceae bacterium]|jgi:hypothetical protein|nr:hypothetical protein [Xanthomonadaceae bacterium]
MQPNQPLRDASEAIGLALLLSAAVFILQWRYGFNWADEGWLWYVSQRVHFGQMSIRDFFGYDPGRYLWSAAWFKALDGDGLFEQRLANSCFGIIGLAAAYAAMAAAQIRRPLRIATLVLLAIALGFPQHKIYEQSLSLIGVAVLAHALFRPELARRWFLVGLATAIAAIIGRNSGVYFAIGSWLGLLAASCLPYSGKTLRGLHAWVAGTALGYAPMLAWFAIDPRFRAAMIASILFTPQWQLPLPIPFPWRVAQTVDSTAAMQATAVGWLCIAVIATYAAAGVGVVRTLARKLPADRLSLLEAASLCIGLPYLHQAFDRADFSHIAQGILPAFLVAAVRFQRDPSVISRSASATLACLALLAWIPSEPRVAAHLAFRRDPGSLVHFAMDGRDFILDRDQARVLQLSRTAFERCGAGPGQFVAMPHYPGILAYLHAASPYWELYYLYHRTPAFQQTEISAMRAQQTKVALINRRATVDGRDDLRIERTNPLLVGYIRDHFQRLPPRGDGLDDFEFFERDCMKPVPSAESFGKTSPTPSS